MKKKQTNDRKRYSKNKHTSYDLRFYFFVHLFSIHFGTLDADHRLMHVFGTRLSLSEVYKHVFKIVLQQISSEFCLWIKWYCGKPVNGMYV